jgi:adenylate cyclase
MSFLDIFKSFFSKSKSMQAHITMGITLLLISTSAIIISYNYLTHRDSIMGMSGDLIAQMNKTIIHRTSTYLVPVIELIEVSSSHVESGVLNIHNKQQVERYFMSALKQYPQIAMFNFSDPEGNFFMAKRLNDGNIGIKYVLNEEDQKNEYWKYYDKENKVVKREGPTVSSYNALKRPWYMGAIKEKGIFLTDVYTFFTDKKLGITASLSIYDKWDNFRGVIAVDIHLNTLSVFLDQQQYKSASHTYILDQNNNIVAAPQASAEIMESQINTLKPLLEDGKGLVGNRFKINLDDKESIVLVTQFPAQFKKAWKIVFIIPTEVLLREINKSNTFTIIISILILIFAVIVSKRWTQSFTKPIIELTKMAERIKNFNIGKQKSISSRTFEIQQMAATFESMESSLKSFQKYIPKSVVKDLVRSGVQAELGGKKETLSIMFTDVAGFTSLSEGISPEELTLHLSEYLEGVTSVIKRNKGTIDKYIGDAIMSFWGAPKRIKDHAYLSCKAALECKEKIDEMNKAWKKEGKMVFETRIGINTGSCIVGNIGSKERMNYTVLGDNVNLAARLEGVNKLYGTTIIISENTYEKIADRVIVRPLDLVVVKGKKKGIYIYELLGLKKGKGSRKLASVNTKFSDAVFHYLQQQWPKSLGILEELDKDNPNDKVIEMYINRCKQLIKKTPKNWDGSVKLTEK